MKNWMIVIFVSVAALGAIAAAGFYVIERPVQWLEFNVWKSLARQSHGGQYADINNVRIYYETYGAGKPVLVLHGGLGSIADMGYQIKALAPTRFVIAIDSRGHGRSTDTDAPLSYGLMSDDVVKLLDHLKIDRTDIIGWSDGGIIGLDLAERHPDRVGKLVVISANYDVDGVSGMPAISSGEPHVPLRYRLRGGDPAFYRKVVTMWQTQPHYTLNDLGHIKAPTLVMAGEFDVIKREHTDLLARAIPDSQEVIIAGGSHTALIDKPDVVNAHIQKFLGS